MPTSTTSKTVKKVKAAKPPKPLAVPKTAPKAAEHIVEKPAPKKVAGGRYFFAMGRRKTARANVKLFVDGTGEIKINDRAFENYFPTYHLQKIVTDPLAASGLEKKVNLIITVSGGGVASQAKASCLGISQALLLVDPNFRAVLKKQGLLTRDARKKERKKPGLKRARRAPQWQKR